MAKENKKGVAKSAPSSISKSVKPSQKVVSTAIVVQSLQKKANGHINKLKKFEKVKTPAEFKLVGEQVKLLKAVRKEAEEEEERMVSGLKQSLLAIKQHFKPFYELIDGKEEDAKAMMLTFSQLSDEKIEQANQAVATGRLKVGTYTDKVNALQIDNSGAGKIKKTWKLFIDDEKKIPREFLIPDETAIKDHFKKGGKVAGCTWKQVKGISI